MSHCHTLRDNSFSVQRVQLSSDDGNTAVQSAVAAVVTRCPLSRLPSHLCWCECWVSPLYRHYIVSRAPLSPHLSHSVTMSRCVTLPLVTGDAVSRHCAPLRSPRTTGRGRPAQPTFYCTPHMSHVYTCTPHMSNVHTVHVCESIYFCSLFLFKGAETSGPTQVFVHLCSFS